MNCSCNAHANGPRNYSSKMLVSADLFLHQYSICYSQSKRDVYSKVVTFEPSCCTVCGHDD